jgi:hypothetical protein
MRLKKYIFESEKGQTGTGLGADGLSKAKLKTLLYKETKKCTYNKLYKDNYWHGPNCIWDAFNRLNLAWNITKTEYKTYNNTNPRGQVQMPDTKEWQFEIFWNSKEGGLGKQLKLGGHVTASGAGTVEDPLSRYDVNMVIW